MLLRSKDEMNKQNISKLLIFLITVTLGTVKAYGYAEAEQSVSTTVQPTVAVEKLSSSIETGSVNPQTGVHTGLSSIFSLQTNGDDDDYDFIITSKILSSGEEVSAYGNDGSILFGHTLATPTADAVSDAKAGGSNNKNVIAYPVTLSVVSPMTAEFEKDYGLYGDCYAVKVNGGTGGNVTHIVGQTPISGTYSVGQDQAGTYQAVVTFTAVSK